MSVLGQPAEVKICAWGGGGGGVAKVVAVAWAEVAVKVVMMMEGEEEGLSMLYTHNPEECSDFPQRCMNTSSTGGCC